MRIITGKAKGVQLKAPPRRVTRPTTALAKEAVFSILESSAGHWDRVLDLYAGSGALGLEALSRGVEWADFVDRNRKCCDIIKDNLDKANLLNKAHVYCCSASKALSFLSHNYDIVFIDPPFADPSTGNLLAALANSRVIGEGTIVVVGHANRFPLSPDYAGLHLVEQRRYGDTFINIYQWGN